MKIKEIVDILDAEVLSGEDSLDREIEQFAAGNLLSDVLILTEGISVIPLQMTEQELAGSKGWIPKPIGNLARSFQIFSSPDPELILN
jgi:hypothetical protein